MKRSGTVLLGGLALWLLGSCATWAEPPEAGSRDAALRSQQPLATLAPESEEVSVALPVPKPAPPETVVESFTGIASWYGRRFHGKLTASGEPYDMTAMTAAHRALPFGSRVRVTNLDNGRSVVVVINDRGPYEENRLIDLSRAAATKLGIVDDGVAKVRLDVLADESEQAAGPSTSLN